MNEVLEVFDLDGNYLADEEREIFYQKSRDEFKKTQKITRQIKQVRLLLLNSQGNIFLQKRSKAKMDNKGLYDKTIGGHVTKGYSFDLAIMKECAEELGFPAAVLKEEEFEQAKSSVDLSIIGILKQIDLVSDFLSTRVIETGDRVIQPAMATFYIGYYNGSLRFVDGESSGIEVFSLPELTAELEANPDRYTEDIKYMLDHYQKYLIPTG